VTLFNALLKRGPGRTAPGDLDRETDAEFYTNNILIGDHVESEERPFLNGALLHLTGLEEWWDTTGFSGKLEHKTPGELATETVDISFKASASPHYDLGDGRLLRFLTEYRGPFVFGHRKNVVLAERNTIELVFSDIISINQILGEIHIWQTFITFGLRRPSYIDEVMLLVQFGAENFSRLELIVPGRRPDPPTSRRGARDVLFNRPILGSNIANYLRAWRQKHDDIEMAILLFSGVAYQDTANFHTNLLTYLQALEILHRESFKLDRFPSPEARKATIKALRAAVPEMLGATLQDEIRDQIGYVGILTLLDRLKHLYSLYPKSLSPLFRRGDKDMVLLKDTRNFLTHYGEEKSFGRQFLWSRTIFVLKEKTQLFVEVCLLGVIGMSDDQISELLERFVTYKDWRMETSMEILNEMIRAAEGVKDLKTPLIYQTGPKTSANSGCSCSI